MSQNLRDILKSKIKPLALLLCCVTLFSMLSLTAFAADVESSDITAAETENIGDASPSLSRDTIKSLAEIISAAQAKSKGTEEENRTPRDKLTAAYIKGDLAAAVDAIKLANEAAKKPVEVDYESITLADVEELIIEMKTKVEIDSSASFFDKIKLAAGSILSFLTNTLGGGNYIIGLIIFSLIVELALLPLAIKQQKNSIKQASLRPMEAAIRKKYAGRTDAAAREKINREIQEMYQRENFNPLSGCGPLFIQLPIIFLLYGAVVDPVVYFMKLSSQVSQALLTFAQTSIDAGGLGQAITSNTRGTIGIAALLKENPEYIDKLRSFLYFSNSNEVADALSNATLPNFNLFGLNLGEIPSLTNISWLLIFPVLTFIVYFASMKITRKFTYQPVTAEDPAAGCSNNLMDIGMPLFSVFISFSVPAALGLYWIVKSILGTVTRIVLSLAMPLPKFTPEDYKAAERELRKGSKGSTQASRPAARPSSSGQHVRSLHHIDDEDFEDTREQALARKAKLEEAMRAEEAEKEKKMAAAGVKSEDDRPKMGLRDLLKKKKDSSSLENAADADQKEHSDKSDKTDDETLSQDNEDTE